MTKIISCWFGIASLFILAEPTAAADRPNVIIILADDLGYGDLSCYGHPKFKTPNIDQLANEGARLTHFYSSMPFCAPTRASLMTGRYPFRHGLMGNPFPKDDPIGKAGDHLGLATSEVTLAQLFKAAGYRTRCVGKWHLGHQWHFRPLRRGFEEYYGILYSNDMHRVELWDGDQMVEYPVVQSTLTRRYTERALEFIERNKDNPFFLYLPHAMPHKPLAVSEGFYQKSGAGLYGDVMAELDWSVGQITAKLKALELEKKTLVVFTSDNGAYFGGSTGGLRGMKGQSYEGGIRVPMIARWPVKIPAGQVIAEPGIMHDLFTTSLSAANLPLPANRVIDGKDLLPVLTAKAKSPHEMLFTMRGDKLAAVRSGNWKLHMIPPGPPKEKVWRPGEKWNDPRRPDGVRFLAPFEQYHPSDFPGVLTGDPFNGIALFDLEKDPAEQHNVAEQHPEVVQRLKDYFEKGQSEAKAGRRH